ncbi:ABC transporter ATP-binding protein [Arenibaculum pallidiluteum]|uniref:ABC transporter ATP-binding protein n=1 Tax=Arenibaculum pallidiluteum TaxID=2812559 RepID=UPI001A957211|nr:ATP-binding cassette domain-containing protein [Arenibaculum pallidiluteum]
MPRAGGPPRLALEIRSKRFEGREVLHGLRLEVAAGEAVALIGPSGSGKTTALTIAAGLDEDFEGSVTLGPGVRLAYVFQAPRLLPWRSVRDNVALALPRAQRRGPTADRLLAEVGLEGCAGQYPGELSGGMQRRAALARAFALDADILLLDEAFVSLDGSAAALLRSRLAAHLDERGRSLLLVTHDLDEALELADRIVLLGGTPARDLADLPVPGARSARPPDFGERFRRDHAEILARAGLHAK